jgi:hypothetical protein
MPPPLRPNIGDNLQNHIAYLTPEGGLRLREADEVQMVADEGRGANLEFILMLLKMRRRNGLDPQLIALSAVIGDTNGLERWLGGRLLRRIQRNPAAYPSR